MPRSLHLQAPAKLNLCLSVGPPGPDRMHPIASWMVTIDLQDEVELERLEDPALSMYAVQWHRQAPRKPEIDWPMSRDLAARAHQALERHVDRALPLRMKIEKRIPLGSGLGGGSADAAAVLRGTNELFELGLGIDELAEIGSGLGSDVPFMVHGGSAIVEGLGERIETQTTLPDVHAVVVFPDLHCSTAAVYGWFDDLAEDNGDAGIRPNAVRSLAEGGCLTPDGPFNDLAEPALRTAPRLADHLEDLARLADNPAHVTGSGCAIYTLCDQAIHAEALATAIFDRLGLPAIAVTSCNVPEAVSG
ncbi:MAG: 4-(cytidine 5'-diphospho)-2-C-methyl-D-erythritol kinase [Phycisphaerales bacterium]|nr:4-(cytidine 5'-diphospho)-2-C-methyl-D-erythritol kinase [Phycisphaerales bacterium]